MDLPPDGLILIVGNLCWIDTACDAHWACEIEGRVTTLPGLARNQGPRARFGDHHNKPPHHQWHQPRCSVQSLLFFQFPHPDSIKICVLMRKLEKIYNGV